MNPTCHETVLGLQSCTAGWSSLQKEVCLAKLQRLCTAPRVAGWRMVSMLSYRDANLLLGLLWHSPNAQRERKVPNTTACRVHFSCDCICILTTTTYYHHLSSTFVRVQNDVKHSDSQLNSVASMLRVKPTRSILRFHRVGQAPYFYLCDEQLLVLDFSLFTGESYLSSSQLITSFCTGSIIFHLFCFQHHRIEQYFYIESSSSILPKKKKKLFMGEHVDST